MFSLAKMFVGRSSMLEMELAYSGQLFCILLTVLHCQIVTCMPRPVRPAFRSENFHIACMCDVFRLDSVPTNLAYNFAARARRSKSEAMRSVRCGHGYSGWFGVRRQFMLRRIVQFKVVSILQLALDTGELTVGTSHSGRCANGHL